MADFAAHNNARDRLLRIRMLRVLETAKANPAGVRGQMMIEIFGGYDPVDGFEDDDHLIGLLRDLEGDHYITVVDLRVNQQHRLAAETISAQITVKGTRFLQGHEPPNPLIADGRIVK